MTDITTGDRWKPAGNEKNGEKKFNHREKMSGNEHKMKDTDLLRNCNSNAIKLLFDINSTWQASCKKKNFELHILHDFH